MPRRAGPRPAAPRTQSHPLERPARTVRPLAGTDLVGQLGAVTPGPSEEALGEGSPEGSRQCQRDSNNK